MQLLLGTGLAIMLIYYPLRYAAVLKNLTYDAQYYMSTLFYCSDLYALITTLVRYFTVTKHRAFAM